MPTTQGLRSLVLTAIADSCYLKPEEIEPGRSLLDLGLDSLIIASIVATVENRANRKFDADDLVTLFESENVAEFVNKVLAKVDSPDADACLP